MSRNPSRSSDDRHANGAVKPNLPPWVDALDRIGASDLPALERDLLRVLLRWWNDSTGELWPSTEVVAIAWGRSRRTVEKYRGRLEAQGIIEITERSRGGPGKTNRMRIHLDRINPARGAGLEEGEPGTVDRVIGGITRHAAHDNPARGARNPARGAGEPSIHNHPGEPRVENPPNGDGCMAGQNGDTPEAIRAALSACGIRGPNLDLLADCGRLTVAMVRIEASSVSAGAGVRNHAAVLFDRLAELARVESVASPRLDAAEAAGIGKIEAARRNNGGGRT